jgi:hypothetical protein
MEENKKANRAFSYEELEAFTKEAVFQITGKHVVDPCPMQGDAEFQIIFYYLNKVNKQKV